MHSYRNFVSIKKRALAWPLSYPTTHMLWKHSLSSGLCPYSLLSSDWVCFLFNLKIFRENTLISSKRNKHRQRSEGCIPWKLSIVEQSARQLAQTRECRSHPHQHWGLGITFPHSHISQQSKTLCTEDPFPQLWGKGFVCAFECYIWIFVNKSIVFPMGITFLNSHYFLPCTLFMETRLLQKKDPPIPLL